MLPSSSQVLRVTQLTALVAAAGLCAPPALALDQADPREWSIEITYFDEPSSFRSRYSIMSVSPLPDDEIRTLSRWIELDEQQASLVRLIRDDLLEEFLPEWVEALEAFIDAESRLDLTVNPEDAKLQEELVQEIESRELELRRRFETEIRLLLTADQEIALDELLARRERARFLRATAGTKLASHDLSLLLQNHLIDTDGTPGVPELLVEYGQELGRLAGELEAARDRIAAHTAKIVAQGKPTYTNYREREEAVENQREKFSSALREALPAYHQIVLHIEHLNQTTYARLMQLLSAEDARILQGAFGLRSFDEDDILDLYPSSRFAEVIWTFAVYHSIQFQFVSAALHPGLDLRVSLPAYYRLAAIHLAPPLSRAQIGEVQRLVDEYEQHAKVLSAKYPLAVADYAESLPGTPVTFELPTDLGTIRYEVTDTAIATTPEPDQDEAKRQLQAYRRDMHPFEQSLIDRLREILTLEQRIPFTGL